MDIGFSLFFVTWIISEKYMENLKQLHNGLQNQYVIRNVKYIIISIRHIKNGKLIIKVSIQLAIKAFTRYVISILFVLPHEQVFFFCLTSQNYNFI